MSARCLPWQLGLTGGIGSGKSTVAGLLAECGAAVIDADAIARAVTAPGGSAIAAIASGFGAELMDASGALDRNAMRALVYRDPGARARLEAIVHPLVGAETDRQARAALDAGHKLLVFDVPLLVEAGTRWRARLDRVLVVDCPPALQIERVLARSQLPRAQIEQIMAAQATRAQRLAVADWVLWNGPGVGVPDLREQAARLARRMGL